MKQLPMIGKFMFVIPMAIFGLFHFLKADAMAGMVPIPGGVIWVYITGLALIASAVAVIIGKKAKMAMQLLGLMLVIFAVTIHLPSGEAGMQSLLKDLALAGGAWFISGQMSD